MLQKKKHLIVMLTVMLAFSVALASFAGGATVAAADEASFEKTDSVTIAHITDSHYFTLNYCEPNAGENTDFGKTLITGTKLLLESSFIVKQGLKEVLDNDPDYLFVTGDLTLDGELQSHIEFANLLRELQNAMRIKNPDFQIFVTAGNHDMYNGNSRYDNNGMEETAYTVTRKQFTKIYSSLGFPDLTDGEIEAFYASLPEVLTGYLPYTPVFVGQNYVNSSTAPNINIIYQYQMSGREADVDYPAGDMTYIALDGERVILGLDEEVSDYTRQNHIGGKIFDSTYAFIDSINEIMPFAEKQVFALSHHNALPHFDLEDTLLKDFTLYQWKDAADYLADLGVRYMFTGHMHANDIVSGVSFNNNQITDLQTGSITGYLGGTRYTTIERGTLGGEYAEIMKSKIDLVDETDFTYLFHEGYMNAHYLELCQLEQYLEKRGDDYICLTPGEYAATKLFRNIVDNVMYGYLNPDFIFGIGDLLSGLNLPSQLSGMLTLVDKLLVNIVDHWENVVLADYTYGGATERYKSTEPGYKLCGYLEELVNEAVSLAVNDSGDILVDFGIGSYLAHQGGTDGSLSNASASMLQALNNFKSGKLVKQLLDILLSEQSGLMKLVKGLTLPMDLGKNMTSEELDTLNTVFGLLLKPAGVPNYVFNAHAVKLDDHVGGILNILKSFMGIDLSLNGKTLVEFIDDLMASYITDSFYKGLGEIACEILYSFRIDETEDGGFNEFKTYYPWENSTVTYTASQIPVAATVENGKLPSMLTVTFGADPKTEKNFVWFTDKRVTDTDIQYIKGEWNEENVSAASGNYRLYATTTAAIDLGVFATLLPIETGRHTLSLTGLEAGQMYSYRVGSAEDNFWSPVYTFTTAPDEDTPFEVLLMTDLQGFAKSTYENANRIMENLGTVFENGYDFIVNCGDTVDNSRNLLHFEYLLNTLSGKWGNTTQVVATGNHEEYAYEFDAEDDDPLYLTGLSEKGAYNYLNLHYQFGGAKETLTGAYYSFDYSGVHFTVLNTNELDNLNRLSKAQTDWLKKDLAETDKKFKVVIMHKGIYTAGSHNTDRDVMALRNQLTSIFADNGVALVLQGHDHTYTESYYLDREGKIVVTDAQGQYKLGSEGTLYVNLGSMGDKFYNYIGNEKVPVEFGQTKHTPTLKNPTFGKLVFDGESLYYKGYEYDLATDTITEIRYVAPEEPNEAVLKGWEIALIVTGAVLFAAGVSVGAIAIVKSKKKIKLK